MYKFKALDFSSCLGHYKFFSFFPSSPGILCKIVIENKVNISRSAYKIRPLRKPTLLLQITNIFTKKRNVRFELSHKGQIYVDIFLEETFKQLKLTNISKFYFEPL